jgi:DNA-binding XRE family transcriptional regulator
MSKRRNFDELRERLRADPEARARVEQYRHAMRDALALSDLRQARHATQAAVARSLGVSKANVSRVEHQEDVYLSTLRQYVSALGGELEIRAVFPDETVTLDVARSRR